jgi:hypothetical protein
VASHPVFNIRGWDPTFSARDVLLLLKQFLQVWLPAGWGQQGGRMGVGRRWVWAWASVWAWVFGVWLGWGGGREKRHVCRKRHVFLGLSSKEGRKFV